MSKKMPKEIWLQAPIDTPEKGWKDGEVTWCWHPINENEDNDPDTKYLRADTCTPNEECVSKAELEKEIRRIEKDIAYHRDRGCVNTPAIHFGQADVLDEVVKRLREVMDK